jgi:uncharacterized membrane protein
VPALPQIFAYVCGQTHSWAVGGATLPFCQRCTGLYVGGAYAILLLAIFRPRPTNLLLWLHGLAMLVMIPFGFHLVPQGAEVRTASGLLFAFGLAYFLALVPSGAFYAASHHGGAYLVALAVSLPALLLAIRYGGARTAELLAWVGFAGLIGFAVLAAGNLALLPRAIFRLRPRTSAAP